MTARVVAISVLAAVAVGLLVRALVREPRSLVSRVEAYSSAARQTFATFRPERPRVAGSGSLFGVVFGPMVQRVADRFGRLAEGGATDSVERRLELAGIGLSVEQYRVRQLGYTLAACAGGGLFGLVVGGGAATVVVLAFGAGLWGALRWRARLDRAITRRREKMRAELYSVCQLLAVYTRTGDTPSGSIERLVRRADGAVIAELAEACDLIRSGRAPSPVFDDLTGRTAEPQAARLYRLIGATWSAGGDPDALLALGDDLRASRREDLQRMMTRRETVMAIPLVLVMGPIMILFVAAAIPSIVFGR